MNGTLRVLRTGQNYHVMFIPKGQSGGALPPRVCADLDEVRDVLSDTKVDATARKKLLDGANMTGGVTAEVAELSERNLRGHGLIL